MAIEVKNMQLKTNMTSNNDPVPSDKVQSASPVNNCTQITQQTRLINQCMQRLNKITDVYRER
ncbi:MAG: hypothetical protein V5786_07920 [Psychromonas sp.]